MARKRKTRKTRSETVAAKAKRLGITLPKAADVQSAPTTYERRSRRSAVVGTKVAVNGAVTVGQGRITRFVVPDGDGYAVRLKGRTIASGFATPDEAWRYASALRNRRFRKLADPKLRLEQPAASPTETALRDAGHDRETVAELLLLANSGAVRVTVR